YIRPHFILFLDRAPSSTLFPYTTLFRSYFQIRGLRPRTPYTLTRGGPWPRSVRVARSLGSLASYFQCFPWDHRAPPTAVGGARRSEEHTSELQSLAYLVCRLLL